MFVSGGNNFLTSRGSNGVKVANYECYRQCTYNMRSTYKFDKFDRHPIVTTVNQEFKESWGQR